MSLLRWLLAPFVCPHTQVIRERRDLHGVSVPHYVCACGYAVPVIARRAEEHRSIARLGAVTPLKVVRETAADRARQQPRRNVARFRVKS